MGPSGPWGGWVGSGEIVREFEAGLRELGWVYFQHLSLIMSQSPSSATSSLAAQPRALVKLQNGVDQRAQRLEVDSGPLTASVLGQVAHLL